MKRQPEAEFAREAHDTVELDLRVTPRRWHYEVAAELTVGEHTERVEVLALEPRR